ncbi:Embryo defective 1273 [Hirschfeldia incana]|nr:Embryo defective 1273 [Hirschfeldia incana]
MAMSHLFLSSPQPSLAPRLHSPTQFYSNNSKSFKAAANEAKPSKRLFLCRSIHMESDHSGGDSKRLTFDTLLRKAKDVWNDSPQPVKDFPWNRAFENFVQLVLDLAISVIKLLFVPVLAVSSVSEMSYCAHERKLALVPFPLVIGIVVGGVLQGTALNISPRLKEAEVPWHLIAMMMFFTLIKLPGPYYPYWGRLLIPHFANGVLVRALWSMFFWYKKTRNTSGNPLQNHSSETK